MEIKDLVQRFSDTTEHQCKAIFSTLFIAGNRLQTLFDRSVPGLSLKQFMLLTMVRQSGEPLTFTQLGRLLGCSRQNIKKLAGLLERKGFVVIRRKETDVRASRIDPTEKLDDFFDTVFVAYQRELRSLFEGYTPDEIEQLFHLMMKLYPGIDNMEARANGKDGSDL